MKFVDTHCHIHSSDYGLDPIKVINNAKKAGVTRLICVGCTLEDSKLGIKLASKFDKIYASIGIHPHEAKHYVGNKVKLDQFSGLLTNSKIVAIGECGLDYFYNHSPKADQIEILEYQLELATKHGLPVIFHVRDAFADFWKIYDKYPKIRGVVHSFTADKGELNNILERGLLVGINGIITFTKEDYQTDMVKKIPISSILLETDSPFLTPAPYRGTINQPKHIRRVAEVLGNLRGESLDKLAESTTHNANKLFGLEEVK